jgi:hypothetical protein
MFVPVFLGPEFKENKTVIIFVVVVQSLYPEVP